VMSSIILKVTALAVSLISEGHVIKGKTNNFQTPTCNERPLRDAVQNKISVTIRTWQSPGEYHTSLLNISFTFTVHLNYILLCGINLDKQPIFIIINTLLRENLRLHTLPHKQLHLNNTSSSDSG
jgi:hypothetical protein